MCSFWRSLKKIRLSQVECQSKKRQKDGHSVCPPNSQRNKTLGQFYISDVKCNTSWNQPQRVVKHLFNGNYAKFMLVVKIETKTQNFFYILQLKMNIQLHLWGRSLTCLSTRSPSPHGPNSKHLDEISFGKLSCASSCTWFNSWLILDSTIRTMSLSVPVTWPEHTQVCVRESSLIIG